jgi:hypothetical protein
MKKMPLLRDWSLAIVAVLVIDVSSLASIAINIGGGEFRNATNQSLPPGSLLQLVNLGPDGSFNPIDVTDGGSRWVSGDDALLSAPFMTGAGAAGDFPSTDAFDLFKGADTPGTLDRVFEFASSVLPLGAKLGIRWFPNLLASDFASTTLQPGQRYGEFTRQQNPIHGGTIWVVPSDGANVTFDPLVTQSFGGMDSNNAGVANFVVIPESSSGVLILIGVTGLLQSCRRTK